MIYFFHPIVSDFHHKIEIQEKTSFRLEKNANCYPNIVRTSSII
jgi:hypothetical protein